MTITLYEQVDMKKLMEVINCENLPVSDCDDEKNFNKRVLEAYSKKDYCPTNGIEIKYFQKNEFGRYYCKNGLQFFKKDVRKYISGEFVRDLDFNNCHPVIIQQLFEKNGLDCGNFLKEYNADRDACIKQYNLEDKLTLISVINNEKPPIHFPPLIDLHNKIYNILVPKILKQNYYKNIFKRISHENKLKKKDYNHYGSFFSQYLQDIENSLLMALFNYFKKLGIKVHTLMFDGLTIDKNRGADIDFEACEAHIKKQTGFSIKIVEKSVETTWKPKKEVEEVVLGNDPQLINFEALQFDREHLDALVDDCYTNEGVLLVDKCKEVVKYLNNFMCLFERPFCFGFRFNTSQDYEIKKQKGDIIAIITDKCFSWFMKYNCRLQYIKPVFIVNENDPILKHNVYNSYQRPKYIECSREQLEKQCPLFFDFLKRIISDGDNNIFDYLLNYMAKIVQVGLSSQCLVLKGKMGVGKSTFGDILKLIVENHKNQYSKNINDITDLMNRFNALDAQCIITTIEEVIADAGAYHSVQNKLKDLITAETIKLERKGIDAIMVPSQNNIVIITNNLNPVEITGDNRRYLILYVPDYEKCNSTYFVNVKKEIIANIEYIRGFLYKYQYEDNLNKIRPITQAEMNLRELHKPPIERFIEEEIHKYVVGSVSNADRKFMNVYNHYQSFCCNQDKKPLSKNYFSLYLKENGFDIQKKGTKRSRFIYRKGECLNETFKDDKSDSDSESY